MDLETVLGAWVPALTTLLVAGATLYRIRVDRRTGVQTADREDEVARDVAADRLLGRMETRLSATEAARDRAEASSAEKAVTIRDLGDHVDLLEAHIWEDKGPPPPARPPGL